METDTIAAWQVEQDDYITLGSDTAWRVTEKHDDGDSIRLVLRDDDDGETDEFTFTPDDEIQVVTRWDDDDVEFEEVDPDE